MKKLNIRSFVRILFRHRIKSLIASFLLIFILMTSVSYWKISRHYHHISYHDHGYRERYHEDKISQEADGDESRKQSDFENYCNHPEMIEVKDEVIDESTRDIHSLILRSVFVLIRHGDRGPLRPVKDLNRVQFDPLKEQGKKYNLEENLIRSFKQMNETIDEMRGTMNARKQLRSPTLSSFDMIPKSKTSLGQLSVLGFLQHLHQGNQIASVYLPLLGNWIRSDTESKQKINEQFSQVLPKLEVHTTSYQRTYQSAVGFLSGFLSNFLRDDIRSNMINGLGSREFWQNIVHSIESKIKSSHGTFFCMNPDHCLKCKNQQELDVKLESVKQDILSLHPAVKNLMQDIIDIITEKNNASTEGAKVGASKDAIYKSSKSPGLLFTSPEAVFDGLMSYVCHGSNLPCHTSNGRCVTLADAKRINSFIINRNKGLLVNEDFVLTCFLKTKGFLEHLNWKFEQISKERKKDPSSQLNIFTLFSGHDITLVPVAVVLGFWDANLPPYASRIVFEVYHRMTDDGLWVQDTFVRILYNGKDVTKNTEICRRSNSVKTVCQVFEGTKNEVKRKAVYLIPVKEFDTFITRKFIALAKTDNFEEACYRLREELKEQQPVDQHESSLHSL